MSEQIIEVVEEVEEEVTATGAELRVAISGARFFAGSAALQHAAEVRRLIDALIAIGVSEGDIGIASIRVSTDKGTLLKSSSANYGLMVRCRETKLVAEVIDAIAAQKNCRLEGLTWNYDVPDETRHAWLARCVLKARAAAEAMAGALGAKVAGVQRVVDVTRGEPADHRERGAAYAGSAPGSVMKRRLAELLEDLELAPKQEQRVRIRASFLLGD